MKSLGGLLFFLGAGSVVLQLFNYEFMLLAPLSPYQPIAGIVVAIIGAGLIAIAEIREREAASIADAAPGAGATSNADAAPLAAPLASSGPARALAPAGAAGALPASAPPASAPATSAPAAPAATSGWAPTPPPTDDDR